MKDIKKNILLRVYLIYGLFFLSTMGIIARVLYIQFAEGDKLKIEQKETNLKYINIEENRGNIYSDDGNSLLATSLPTFEVRMDASSAIISHKLFYNSVDSLAYCLSELFHDRSQKEYRNYLINARKKGDRFCKIKSNVKYDELKKLRKFPIFRLGKYKGGLIVFQKDIRKLPFDMLAIRTIGYAREGIKPVGIEGAYKNYLKGTKGKRLMKKISGNVWVPVNYENELDPKNGNDIITTIDINIQDVAESALMTQLQKHNADHGCVILMEVETGQIKAIANLKKCADNLYREIYNYAIGECIEPGSTFKLASLIVGMDQGILDTSSIVDTENGTTEFFNQKMTDSHEGGYGKISLKHAFEVSSNVGISKSVYRAFCKNPDKFINGLYDMGLNKKLGIEISGEGQPGIKNTHDIRWSGVSLPWMSIGYELTMTPIQILTFYNAVANDGVMVKPLFVKQIVNTGKTIRTFEPVIINKAICSEATIGKAKKMLEGVVENGTAKSIFSNSIYKVAGKTGTAIITDKDFKVNKIYNASFVGYFPADNPKFSCIVVINNPSEGEIYGSTVAAPVFKEIADKVYATRLEIPNILKDTLRNILPPMALISNTDDLFSIYKTLSIYQINNAKSEWASALVKNNHVEINNKNFNSGIVPNVIGMKARDAIYILENMGLNVRMKGKGTVKGQSIKQGSKAVKGEEIVLNFS